MEKEKPTVRLGPRYSLRPNLVYFFHLEEAYFFFDYMLWFETAHYKGCKLFPSLLSPAVQSSFILCESLTPLFIFIPFTSFPFPPSLGAATFLISPSDYHLGHQRSWMFLVKMNPSPEPGEFSLKVYKYWQNTAVDTGVVPPSRIMEWNMTQDAGTEECSPSDCCWRRGKES